MSGPPLTLDERYLIHNAVLGGLKPAEIAQQLRRHRSVIYDELARGKDRRGRYCPHLAQARREAARARSAANGVGKPEKVWARIGAHLKAGWSPEQISGRWKLLGQAVQISTPAIYAGVLRRGWRQYLHRTQARSRLQRPARRPWAGKARPIQQRLEEADLRIVPGHWEADTMTGKKRDKKRLLHMVERRSLYWELALLDGLQTIPTVKTIKRRLERNGLPFETVATDRGSEFIATGELLGDKALACDAYCPNQRGTNENQIGALRIDLPKGVSLDHLTPKDVRRLQEKYNHRPRKCLGFLTPYEVAFNCHPRVGTRT